jgi:chromosome condensin MukBEF ATPase and DNA-binding subunit MukB
MRLVGVVEAAAEQAEQVEEQEEPVAERAERVEEQEELVAERAERVEELAGGTEARVAFKTMTI